MLLISTLKRERGKSKEEIQGISCRQRAEVTHSYFSVSGTVMKKDIVVLWPGLIRVGCPTGSSKCAWSSQRSHLTDAGLTIPGSLSSLSWSGTKNEEAVPASSYPIPLADLLHFQSTP